MPAAPRPLLLAFCILTGSSLARSIACIACIAASLARLRLRPLLCCRPRCLHHAYRLIFSSSRLFTNVTLTPCPESSSLPWPSFYVHKCNSNEHSRLGEQCLHILLVPTLLLWLVSACFNRRRVLFARCLLRLVQAIVPASSRIAPGSGSLLHACLCGRLCYCMLASSATATCTAACHSVGCLCCLPVFLLSKVIHRSGYLTMILTAKPKTSSYRKFLKECAKCAAAALRADQQPFPTQAMHLDMIEMLSLDWCTPPPPLPSSPPSLFPAYSV